MSVTLLVNSESAHKRDAAAKIAAALSTSALQVYRCRRTLGIKFVARLQSGHFDLYYGEYKMTPDWDLTELLTGSCNYGGFANADLTALLTAERTRPGAGAARGLRCGAVRGALAGKCPLRPSALPAAPFSPPSGVIQGLTPSLTDPFYNLSDWKIKFS